MTIEQSSGCWTACYQGKRIRDMLPPLPKGVTSSYIQYLGCHPVAGAKRHPCKNIGHQRCAEPAAPRRDPDRQGDGDGWLSAKENLAGRQTHHLHFHHRSGQGALTDV